MTVYRVPRTRWCKAEERKPVDVPAGPVGAVLYVVMVIVIMALCAAALGGCAVEPVVKTEIQKVDNVITVPCRTDPIAAPAWPMDSVDPEADEFTLAKNALAEIELRTGYETKLKAAVAACQPKEK